MRNRLFLARAGFSPAYFLTTLVVLSGLTIGSAGVYAQRQVSKRFATGKKVRLELKNISGKVTVESWNRDEIKISATLESSSTTVSPKQYGEGVIIDVISDNRGRSDVGNVNFKIQVPLNSTVDITTIMGDISIANIHSDMVRAYVSSEGDIELTSINAKEVYAQNMSGNIFFDGEVLRGGKYQFQAGQGDISIRIPASSTFDLEASAHDRKLTLGQFWNSSFRTVGEGRKYSKTIGNVNDGRAKVIIMNFHGGITFIRR
jgi:DUF4097 and DUF4098 domain-containing protein YvlB